MSRRIVEVTRQGRVGSDGLSNLIGVVTTAVDASVVNADSGKAYRCTAALTLTLPAATSPGWSVIVDADGGDVVLASTMTVNGSASIVLADGNSCLVYSDGSALFARFYYSDEIASSNLTAFAGIDPATLAALADPTFTGTVTIPTLTLTNDLAIVDGGTGSSTAAGARTGLGAAPLPKNASGSGNFVELFQVANTILSLPAGGTWAYFAFFQDNTTGTITSGGLVAGVGAGGANIGGPVANANSYGFAWRIDNA